MARRLVRNHWVSIRDRKKPPNDFDGQPDEWIDVAKCWASIRNLSGDEIVEGQQMTALYTHELRAFWGDELAKVKPTMHVIANDRRFEIKSLANENERNRILVMRCVEVL